MSLEHFWYGTAAPVAVILPVPLPRHSVTVTPSGRYRLPRQSVLLPDGVWIPDCVLCMMPIYIGAPRQWWISGTAVAVAHHSCEKAWTREQAETFHLWLKCRTPPKTASLQQFLEGAMG